MSQSNLTSIDHSHFFVSDTHFGHTGILDMAMRPFADIRAHDRALIDEWNAVVGKNDTVWHWGISPETRFRSRTPP